MKSESNGPFSWIKETAEAFLRVSIILGGLAYIVGLLITNIYLARYGIYVFQLVQAEYILVGFGWLILSSIGYIFFYEIVHAVRVGREFGRWDKTSERIVTAVVITSAVFLLFFLYGLASADDMGAREETLFFRSALYTILVPGFLVFLFLVGYRRNVRDVERMQHYGISGIYYFAFPGLLLFIFYSVYLFSNHVYPHFPKLIGGGKLVEVQLIFREAGQEAAQSLGLDIDPQGRTPRLQLIYETPEAYYILVVPGRPFGSKDPNGEPYSVKIAATDISSVIYNPPPGATVPHLDELVSAASSGSTEALLELVQFSTLPCTRAEGMGGPPKCQAGEQEGTLVEVLPILGPEGYHLRRSELSSWPGIGAAQLYAAFRTPESAFSGESFPAGDYGVAFLLPDQANVVVFQVTEEGIVRIDYHVPASFEELLKSREVIVGPIPPSE